MNSQQRSATAVVALLSFVASAVNALGFVASDLALTKLVRGLGFLAPLLLVGPLGMGVLVVGLLEGCAALALFIGAIMLMCRRRAGTWVIAGACAPGLLAGLLLVTQIVPAPLVFGRTMAGVPTQPVSWAILACTLVTAVSAVALALSRPAVRSFAGQGASSKPCSMA